MTELASQDRYAKAYALDENGTYVLIGGKYVLLAEQQICDLTKNENGGYYLVGGDYISLDGNRFNKTYVFDAAGEFVLDGETFKRLSDIQKYSKGTKEVYTEAENGEYVLIQGVYTLLSSLTKYSLDAESGNYVESADGEYVLNGTVYVLITEQQKYTKTVEDEFTADDSGEWVNLGGVYVELATVQRYAESYEAAENGAFEERI